MYGLPTDLAAGLSDLRHRQRTRISPPSTVCRELIVRLHYFNLKKAEIHALEACEGALVPVPADVFHEQRLFLARQSRR